MNYKKIWKIYLIKINKKLKDINGNNFKSDFTIQLKYRSKMNRQLMIECLNKMKIKQDLNNKRIN